MRFASEFDHFIICELFAFYHIKRQLLFIGMFTNLALAFY